MNKPEIIVIDDEVEVGTFFEFYLKEERGYPVAVARSGKEARALIQEKLFDLALVDLKLPDTDGISLLKEIKECNSDCEVIIMTGYSTVKTAVEAMRLGAFDYIDKPFDELDELDKLLDRALQSVKNKQRYIHDEMKELASKYGIIMADNSPLKNLLLLCKKVAARKISVLIEGETGTGKEVLAKYIHANSPRADNLFIGVNCGALTETLLESELFGHEKGAFTGAQGIRRGIFEVAHKGTILLDEIGESSPAVQVKLLRVLEYGEFFRVGGEKPLKTDVRVLAATNKSLRDAVNDKLFREDLFYRLDVVSLYIPPLRERQMDIMPLIHYFIRKVMPEDEKHLRVGFNHRAEELLQNYSWPGNIRELSNVVARALALRTGEGMGPECLPRHIVTHDRNEFLKQNLGAETEINEVVRDWSRKLLKVILGKENVDLTELSGILEKETDQIVRGVIDNTLIKTGNNRTEASKLLNVSPRVLRYLQKEKAK